MLNVLRESAKSGIMKFILFGIMTIAVGGLVLMDVGGFFRGGVTKTAVAKIDGEELPITVFDRTVRRTLANQGLDTDMAYRLGYIQQMLRNEIANNLLHRSAVDTGIVVGEPVVIGQINKILEPQLTDGIDKKTALTAILRNLGMTERDFVRTLSAEMTNNLLRESLEYGATYTSKSEALDLYLYDKEKRTIETVFLPHSSVEIPATPADEILLPLYQAGQERYAIPETRSFTVAILSSDKLKDTMDVSDDELREIYERDQATYEEPEKRLLEQAIVDTEANATKIADAIKSGTNFKKAVKDVTGSEDAYLGEDSFEKEGLLKDLGEAVFAKDIKIGDIAGPIESPLGWHIVKLTKIQAPKTKPFESVKKQLKDEILHMRLADEMFATANQIDDTLAGGATLEEVVEQINLETAKLGPVKQDGSTADQKDGLKDFAADKGYLMETAFTLMEGEVSPVMEISNGRYAVVRVDTINEKTYKPFEDVKKDIAKVWEQDQREVGNKIRVHNALGKLNNGEITMKDVAAENKASVKSDKLVRADEIKEPYNDAAKKLFFGLPEGQYGFAPVKGGFLLGKVVGVALPDIKDAKEDELDTFRKNISLDTKGEILQFYLAALYDTYDVTVNDRLLQMTYGPGSDQYQY